MSVISLIEKQCNLPLDLGQIIQTYKGYPYLEEYKNLAPKISSRIDKYQRKKAHFFKVIHIKYRVDEMYTMDSKVRESINNLFNLNFEYKGGIQYMKDGYNKFNKAYLSLMESKV